MALPTYNIVTSQFLYGTNEKPEVLFTNSTLNTKPLTEIVVNASDIFNPISGPGRFANASTSYFVNQFFENAASYLASGLLDHFAKDENGDISLTKIEARELFGPESRENGITVDNKDMKDAYDDYAERTYVWGTMAFQVADSAVFKISTSGEARIENFHIEFRYAFENFDWAGGTGISNFGSENVLRPAIDPSDLSELRVPPTPNSNETAGVKISYNWDYTPTTTTYDIYSLAADRTRYNDQKVATNGDLIDAMQQIIDDLYEAGTTKTVYQGKAILFGTHEDDTIIGTDSRTRADISDSSLLFGLFDNPFATDANNGIAYVTGSGDDYVIGTRFGDIFLDGEGADTYSGHGGFDTLLYTESSSAISIDFTNWVYASGQGGSAQGDWPRGIEAVAGSLHNDTITAGADYVEILAGNNGNDTFNVNANSQSPTIVWGGAGADVINITKSEGAVGLYVVSAPNISIENFHRVELQSIDPNIDWSAIDIVIINPDNDDRININDRNLSVKLGTVGSLEDMEPAGGAEEYTLTSAGIAGTTFFDFIGTFKQVFTTTKLPYYAVHMQHRNLDDLRTFIDVEHYLNENDEWVLPYGVFRPDDVMFHTDWEPSTFRALSEMRNIIFEYTLEDITFDTPSSIREWFIVGGQLDGFSVFSTSGQTYVVPESDNDMSGRPRGGKYITNLNSDGFNDDNGSTYVMKYDVNLDVLVINGNPISTASLGANISWSQIDESIIFTFDQDSHIVLKDTSYADWELGANQQIHGTAANDTIIGTTGNDIIVSGGGNDTIFAGGGDDIIKYSFGNDLISSGNTGDDTLEMWRYSSREVHFEIIGDNILITSADGSVLLEDQIKFDIGHSASNIETIWFSDSNFSEWMIRQQAVWDQSTTGSDSVLGTNFSDIIYDNEGNDTITAKGGDDEIYYNSGDDVIAGGLENLGTDTLYLSEHRADDVIFSVDGNDILVSTSAGSIRLQQQIEWDIGNANSNIEFIEFEFGAVALNEVQIRQRAVTDGMTSGDDTISGTMFADTIHGDAGSDHLIGSGGNDHLYGDAGNDEIFGGAGNDLLYGGEGNDSIIGDQGNDAFYGGAGNDVLYGGYGSDSFYGGDGFDFVSYESASTRLNADLRGSSQNTNSAAGDVYVGIEGLIGSNFNDTLRGDDNDNIIFGGAGNDILWARGGDDTLYGGAGSNRFNFSLGYDHDIIMDFKANIDAIAFSSMGFSTASDALLFATQVGSDVLFSFDSNTSLTVLNSTVSGIADSILV